ncbi:MAG: hypothetical protein HC851_07415 [Acaryochloris sp. RU_4_1]|nr:hypothetical protein [Acaryochloris sp. RU_4_1]NJR57112.1 hypothetical protein [Acaryochloris sp. CRU_2_0]
MTTTQSFDHLTLQAFSLALLQLEEPPTGTLQEAVQQIRNDITHQDMGAAAARIRTLDRQYHQSRLYQLYDQEYKILSQQYNTQEKAKSLLHMNGAATAILSLDAIAPGLIAAEDIKASAKNMLKRIQPKQQQASTETQAYVRSLQRAVEIADQPAITILKAIENRPLTLKDLPYFVNLSFEQAQVTVQDLWQKGYIDRTTSNLLHNIFPTLGRQRRKKEPIDPSQTYLTLTSKGYFFLHPFITLKTQGRRIV